MATATPEVAMNDDNDTATTITIEKLIPRFALSELVLGRAIGKGGFSLVSQIITIRLENSNETNFSSAEKRLRSDLSRRANLVLKTLRPDLPDTERAKGVVDLAIEAKFLSELQHDHIITMEGMAIEAATNNFVLLEKLVFTLDAKMTHWAAAVNQASSWSIYLFGFCCKDIPVLHQLWIDRLVVLRDISSALRYLHAKNIVYRDLKPDNIGFDENGVVKLFDFGLAKSLKEKQRSEDGLYNLTGCTGSLRYMAPEVFLQNPYNETADSYSFGILLWQICSLNTPYSGYTCKMHAEFVVHKGYRPKLDPSWPYHWKDIMSNCWSVDIHARPNFDTIWTALEDEIEILDESISMTSDIRAKHKKNTNNNNPDHQRLDVDTRLNNVAVELQNPTHNADPTVRMHDVVID